MTVEAELKHHALVLRQAIIIHNPAARSAPGTDILRAASNTLPGWQVSVQQTEGAGHATMLAAAAATRNTDVVLASGGDGTVNEVVNGIASTPSALAVLPSGTANVWAKELRLPKKLDAALRLLDDGVVRNVDLGRARWTANGDGDRYFLLMAGVGFDAAIVRSISPALKQRLGAASYVIAGIRRALGHPTVEARLGVNGDDLAGGLYWLLAGNTRSYGGLANITYQAVANDGELEFCLLRKGGLHRLAWLLPALLLKRLEGRANVEYRRGRSLNIETPGIPVQLDGEYVGETPMRFEVVPGALRVVVPQGSSDVLPPVGDALL